LDISPIKSDNALPKVFSMKKQKGLESSPEQVGETKYNLSETNVKSNLSSSGNVKETVTNNPPKPTLSETAETSISNPEDVLKGELEDGWGVNDNIILNPTPALESKSNTETGKENKKKKVQEVNKQANEMEKTLQEKDEIIERFAEDNDKLIKERNELKTLSETFQNKVATLDKNLTEILAKNTSLEEQVKKLSDNLVEARKRTSVADIHVSENGVFYLCVIDRSSRG